VGGPDLVLLRHLRDLGFAVVAVGNRDDGQSSVFSRALAGVADIILQRPNHGYDFGAFRIGLLWLRERLSRNSQVLLINNSTYGPFGSLAPILRAADPVLGDAWGLTSSEHICHHIQSYFWLFHPAALRSSRFWELWESLIPVDDHWQTVVRNELPLAPSLLARGVRVRAVIPFRELANLVLNDIGRIGIYVDDPVYASIIANLKERLVCDNPTVQLWRWLLPAGSPLVKKELIRQKRIKMPDVPTWRSILPQCHLADLIADDLRSYGVGIG
jgi:lipopolysaccharide biosynthesis protein